MTYIQSFKIGLLGFILVSCAAQANSENYLSKYQEAIARYQAKDYYEALRLFKEVIPLLKGKKEIISAQFYQAYAFFYEKSYRVSARCFEEFYKTYPRLEQAEEALYMQGYSLYIDTPDVRLDQGQTEKALKNLTLYIDKYPAGMYAISAQQYVKILRDKLALKSFKSAELYYQLGYYQAAVLTLKNFQQEYIESAYMERAAYLKAESQYKFSQQNNSQNNLEDQLNKLLTVIEYCHEFSNQYAAVSSKYGVEVEKIYTITLEKIDNFAKHKNT